MAYRQSVGFDTIRSIDRLPLYLFALALFVMWGCAQFYVSNVVITPAPDQPIWAAYDPQTAGRLIAFAIVGLGVAALVPLRGPAPSIQELVQMTEPLVRRSLPVWTITAVGGVALMIGVKGSLILDSPQYLMFLAPRPLIVLATTPAVVYLLACGVLSSRRPLLGRVLAIVCSLTLFAYGTRFFAACLVVYFVGRRLGGCRVSWQGWFGSTVLLVGLLPIPLISRAQSTHGLVPYANAAWSQVVTGDYFSTIPTVVSRNLGFSIPLLCYVSKVNRITTQDMLISMNPAPGAVAGWDQIASAMRVHAFIPYSALGEWASFGGFALLCSTLVWGLIVRLIIKWAATNRTLLMLPIVATQLGLSVFTIVVSSQYNTRGVSRILSLMIVLAIGDLLVRSQRYFRHPMARRDDPQSARPEPNPDTRSTITAGGRAF